MTDAEIIKALECCIGDADCGECPAYERGAACITKLLRNSLDLINRQKVENERLQKEISKLKLEMSYMSKPNSIGDSHEMGCC